MWMLVMTVSPFLGTVILNSLATDAPGHTVDMGDKDDCSSGEIYTYLVVLPFE